MTDLFKAIPMIFIWLIYALIPLGWIYWLWIAVKIGGFAMFAFALFPLTAPFASILGAWSFLFGLPDWAFSVFVD